MFNDVPSFTELWRKSIYGFKQRVDNSLNKVVNTDAKGPCKFLKIPKIQKDFGRGWVGQVSNWI